MAHSRRSDVAMTSDDIDRFLRQPHVMNLATVRSDGRRHLVAMWYGFAADCRHGVVTYRRSQKVRNVVRVPFVTGLVEAGDTYGELRGVQLVADADAVDDPDVVMAIGRSVTARHDPAVLGGDEADAELARRMAKRVWRSCWTWSRRSARTTPSWHSTDRRHATNVSMMRCCTDRVTE